MFARGNMSISYLSTWFVYNSGTNDIVYLYQVGNHINVQTGDWTAIDSGIGAGVDSYFEYLVKGGILFSDPNLFDMFDGKFNFPRTNK